MDNLENVCIVKRVIYDDRCGYIDKCFIVGWDDKGGCYIGELFDKERFYGKNKGKGYNYLMKDDDDDLYYEVKKR